MVKDVKVLYEKIEETEPELSCKKEKGIDFYTKG